MSLRGLTGVKVPYFKRKYISWYISLSLRKSFEEEELQERKAVLLRKGKRQHWVESRRSSGNSSRSAGRRNARQTLRKICSSSEKWGAGWWLVLSWIFQSEMKSKTFSIEQSTSQLGGATRDTHRRENFFWETDWWLGLVLTVPIRNKTAQAKQQ